MVFQGTISVVSTAFGKDVIDETRKKSRSQIMEGHLRGFHFYCVRRGFEQRCDMSSTFCVLFGPFC